MLNLFAILLDLETRGATLYVEEDGSGVFRASSPKGALTEDVRAGIAICRDGLREAFLLRAGLCSQCGLDPARFPNPVGKTLYTHPETKVNSLHDTTTLAFYPFLCSDCYRSHLRRDIPKEKPDARSAAETTEQTARERVAAERQSDGLLFVDSGGTE